MFSDQDSSTQGFEVYGTEHDIPCSSTTLSSSVERQSDMLLYGVSVLKDRVRQVRSLVSLLQEQPESVATTIDGIDTLVQEITGTASSMLFIYQTSCRGAAEDYKVYQQGLFTDQGGDPYWYGGNPKNNDTNTIRSINVSNSNDAIKVDFESKEYDIVELDVSDILAKYTHYCHLCGKGFKRDANLRMHMRAHGDEYKSNAALSNPMKHHGRSLRSHRKYSCPHEGCRWNKSHRKFQPLKSIVCVKNHYKRSHCPKMYVCNRCSQKQFSVLSDLRTHEKHCGTTKWQCSCGTVFSRKDKLKSHVALFFGHSQVAKPVTRSVEIMN